MYKLLTTAAVIMAVATPMSANEWTGAQKLISDLGIIYDGVGGGANDGAQSHFNKLQAGPGALGQFVDTAGKGVTHITLNVDDVTHAISVDTKVGVTLEEIQTAQGNLINQINYDLFVDTDVNSAEPFTGTPGTNAGLGISAGEIVADGSFDYQSTLNGGLVGNKVAKVVADVNAVNDYLVADGRTKDQADAVVAGIANDATLNGIVDLDGLSFNADIAGLNTATATANDSNNVFFGNINGSDALLDSSTLGGFQVTGFAQDGTVNDGAKTYPTLLDWANDTNGVDN